MRGHAEAVINKPGGTTVTKAPYWRNVIFTRKGNKATGEELHSFSLFFSFSLWRIRTVITPEYSLMSKYLSAAITLLSPERKRRREAGLRLIKRQCNVKLMAGHLLLLIKPLYILFVFLKLLLFCQQKKETELGGTAKKTLTSTIDRREDEGEQASTIQTKQLAIKNYEHHA